jgi:hypothetical protein
MSFDYGITASQLAAALCTAAIEEGAMLGLSLASLQFVKCFAMLRTKASMNPPDAAP